MTQRCRATAGTAGRVTLRRVHRPSQPGRRAAAAAAAVMFMALSAGFATASAQAATETISNGFVGPFPGVSGPNYRYLSRVFVHNSDNPNGAVGACENASDSIGGYVATTQCAYYYGQTYTNLCACELLIGWNWAGLYSGYEAMDGHQDY